MTIFIYVVVDKSTEESKPEANGSSDVSQTQTVVPKSSEEKPEVESTLKEQKDEAPIQNGEISTPSVDAQAKSNVTSSTPVENGTPSKKGKGKAVIKPEPVKTTNTRPKRTAQQLYKNWLDFGEDSEDSDEEDDTFEGPKGNLCKLYFIGGLQRTCYWFISAWFLSGWQIL